jgi:hypothetical protein
MDMVEAGNIVQRAFALAKSGDVHTLEELRRQLTNEGYVLDCHFDGRSMKRQLRTMIAAASDEGSPASMENRT